MKATASTTPVAAPAFCRITQVEARLSTRAIAAEAWLTKASFEPKLALIVVVSEPIAPRAELATPSVVASRASAAVSPLRASMPVTRPLPEPPPARTTSIRT